MEEKDTDKESATSLVRFWMGMQPDVCSQTLEDEGKPGFSWDGYILERAREKHRKFLAEEMGSERDIIVKGPPQLKISIIMGKRGGEESF